ncbi:MAG: GGDEF domain-containing protein [Gaiellaceae bacterium]
MFLVASISAVIGFTVQQLVRRQGALSEQLAELALADALTQLPNRRAWDHRLQAQILRANRRGAALCVAQLDLDHFKRFNDELGHTAGDDLLRACAAEWLRALRGADFLARHGGDEFVILLPDCTLDEALDVTERVRAATRAAQQCSIGVDEWVPGEDGASLVARADTALYRAKASGRDQVGSDADGTAWAGLTAS